MYLNVLCNFCLVRRKWRLPHVCPVYIDVADARRPSRRLHNVFVIGKGTRAYVSLPKGKGVKLTIAEERDRRLAQKS